MPLRLIWKELWGHKLRSLLTVGSLAVAIFLVCFLRTLLVGLGAGVEASAANRLVVQSAVSLFVDLPVAYQAKIDQVEGVEQSCKMQWFGGIYREPKNFFAQFAIDHDRLPTTYPEIQLVDGSWEEFARLRTACIVGRGTAERFGWRVGDRIPINGTIFPRTDGQPWQFDLAGIYASTAANVDEQTMWFRYDYLEESLLQGGASGPEGVGVFVLKVASGADPVAVARSVDGLFANGPQRVQSTSEAEFQRQFVSMLGSVPTFIASIGGGVLFSVLLAVLNTMLMAARQRTRDMGILKALGFTDQALGGLLLVESIALSVLGGAIGVGIALVTQPALGEALQQILPTFAITPRTIVEGLSLSVVVGVLAGIVPSLQARSLSCVEALRAEA